MLSYKSYLLFLGLISNAWILAAQNITGTWQGDLGNDQFLQVNIIQVKDKLCGYTWDYIYRDKKNYCKAYFTGTYNKKKKEWLLEGSSFIEDSTGHLLMKITLWNKNEKDKNLLIGFADTKERTDDLRKGMDDSFSFDLADIFPRLFSRTLRRPSEDIFLKKTAEMPSVILDSMKDCFEEYLKQKGNDLNTSSPSQTDTIKKITAREVIPVIVTDSVKIEKEKEERITKELTHLVVNAKRIRLDVYDNAVVDGDTVTIFYNDRVLLSHQRLSEKPITIDVDLDENNPFCKIVLFAENLGSIPPNTALIVVIAGNKRYELFSSASLTENAMLLLEYKPSGDQ